MKKSKQELTEVELLATMLTRLVELLEKGVVTQQEWEKRIPI